MALKKISASIERGNGFIGNIHLDTGYTVPHGKVFIVSNFNCFFTDNNNNISGDNSSFKGHAYVQNKRGNAIKYTCDNRDLNNTIKGFIFTGGERIFFNLYFNGSFGYNAQFYGNLCGEEIPAG